MTSSTVAADGPADAPAPFRRWQIGNVTVTQVVEFAPTLPITFLFPQATRDVVDANPWLQPDFVDADGNIRMSVHGYVLESEGRRIIVDSGYGNHKHRPFFQIGHQMDGPFLENLADAGYPRETIDTVICTHLHGDHVGWNTMLVEGEWVPTFQAARYLFNSEEFAFWSALQRPDGDDVTFEREQWQIFTDSVGPVAEAGLVDYIDGRYDVTSEITLEPTPGHSPAHASVRIHSGGEEAWIIGDVAHHPVQLARPDWGFSDDDHDAAAATRRALLERLADQPITVFGSHWAGRNAVRIVRHGSAFAVAP